jgi:transposase
MIGPGNGVRVCLAAGTTDMRCGIAGLCARAKNVLGEEPAGGAAFVFRGRMGDRLKILHWDGQGFCLYYKVLERGYFPWPKASAGKVALTPAQMAMLWDRAVERHRFERDSED